MFIDVYSLPKIFSSCTNRVATVVAHSFLRYQPGHWNNPSCSMPYLKYDGFEHEKMTLALNLISPIAYSSTILLTPVWHVLFLFK